MNKEQIESLIKKNFNPSIALKHEITNGTSGESIEIKNAFFNKKWIELDSKLLKYHNSALSFFTEEAFRYFIPAYMIFLIDDIKSADLLSDNVILHLTLPLEVDNLRLINSINQSGYMTEDIDSYLREEIKSSSKRVNSFIRLMKGFTSSQSNCIRLFLEYIFKQFPEYYPNQEPLIAIERFWFQFEN